MLLIFSFVSYKRSETQRVFVTQSRNRRRLKTLTFSGESDDRCLSDHVAVINILCLKFDLQQVLSLIHKATRHTTVNAPCTSRRRRSASDTSDDTCTRTAAAEWSREFSRRLSSHASAAPRVTNRQHLTYKMSLVYIHCYHRYTTAPLILGLFSRLCSTNQMEKVRPWCGQPSDRGRLKNRTEQFNQPIF